MTTAALNDYAVTGSWTDLAATVTGAASVACLIQNIETSPIDVVFGGAGAPTNKTGVRLGRLDSVAGTAANIWVRADEGSGAVSVTLT